MDPKDNAAWNAWATTIATNVAASKVKVLEKQVIKIGEVLVGLAEDVGSEVRRLRDRVKALEGEAAGLRERTASLQGELRGRARDTEVELPALPEAARAHRARQN